MQARRTLILAVAGFALSGLGACGGGGGGGGGSGQTAVGVFRDSTVSGVAYRSAGIESITGDGRFTYEVGTQVSFSIGNVSLGSTLGKPVITPLDLVANATTASPAVQNIVRFLMMLDTDNDPTGRIDISFEVSQAAQSWPQIDFASPTFDADVAALVAEATAVDPLPHSLPSVSAARAHLESTVRCVRAGAYRGSYTGDDTGPFGLLVDASTGLLSGFAWSTEDQALLTLSGASAVTLDQNGSFISGDTSSGATFRGKFSGTDRITGTWENSLFASSGAFSGSRIGGLEDARHRFTGAFGGDAFGLFTFDVDAQGSVAGLAYTVYAAADGTTDELASFTGTLNGTQLVAEIRDPGGVVDATITGTMNTAAGSTSGTWADTDGNRGSFTGAGCRLN